MKIIEKLVAFDYYELKNNWIHIPTAKSVRTAPRPRIQHDTVVGAGIFFS